jgi:hypothetical protein
MADAAAPGQVAVPSESSYKTAFKAKMTVALLETFGRREATGTELEGVVRYPQPSTYVGTFPVSCALSPVPLQLDEVLVTDIASGAVSVSHAKAKLVVCSLIMSGHVPAQFVPTLGNEGRGIGRGGSRKGDTEARCMGSSFVHDSKEKVGVRASMVNADFKWGAGLRCGHACGLAMREAAAARPSGSGAGGSGAGGSGADGSGAGSGVGGRGVGGSGADGSGAGGSGADGSGAGGSGADGSGAGGSRAGGRGAWGSCSHEGRDEEDIVQTVHC